MVTRVADSPSGSTRYSHAPPNGSPLSAMRATNRRGGSHASTAKVIAPWLPCSRHDRPVGDAGRSSTRVTSLRHDGKSAGVVIVDHTSAGLAAMRAVTDATWSV